MLKKGKYYAMKSKHPSMQELDEWIIHYIDNDFPIEEINILIEKEMIEWRDATQQEKRLSYYTTDYLKSNKGIFVNQIDELEKFFKEKGYTFTETD